MSRSLRALAGAILVGACSSATSQPTVTLTPEEMLDRGVDMFGVVVDIPHRQYIGESGATGSQSVTVFRWQAEHTLLERGSSDVLIAVEDLQLAGLPILDEGVELDFVGGMYRDVRYRLAGTLDRITIAAQFDVRVRVRWQLYDSEIEAMVFSGESNGFARGQNLGLTGMQPNALLSSFQDCVGDLFGQAEFAAAIGAGPASG